MRLHRLFDAAGRRQVQIMLWLSLGSASLELLGVTSMLPFMALATNPQALDRQRALQQLFHACGFTERGPFLVFLGALVLLSLTLSNLVSAFSLVLGHRFAHRQQKRLATRLFQSLLARDYAWHVQRHPIHLVQSVAQARNLVDSNFYPLLGLLARLCNVMALVLVLLWYRPAATLVCLFLLLVIYGSVYVLSRRALYRAGTAEWFLQSDIARTTAEPLGGIKDVKLASREGSYLETYAQQLSRLAELQRQKLLATEAPRLILHTLTYGSMLGLVVFLVSRYGGGSEVVAQASMFALAGYRLVPSLQQIFGSLALLENGRAILDNLYDDLLQEPGEVARPLEPLPIHQSVALSGVHFGYDGRPLLRDFDLTLPRHSCIGLVGQTGRGKTTVVNLLVGLLRPDAGNLEVDGCPLVEEADRRRFMRNIGYVPQDVYLSDDTIVRNIALGADEVDREAAVRAAEAACVAEFALGLPNGYDTTIGERGVRLSGGQRQRIGIARALYRNPELLVLDEATSALDGGTESQVMESIQALAHTRTILIVAHRLTTVQRCDCIHLLGPDGIQASGTFQELSQSCPEFQALAGLPPEASQ